MTARLDLTRDARLAALLRSRWPQFLFQAVTLAGFLFTILAGLLGSPVGSSNFAIIFVWIAWWTALKLVFIPIGGRSWCSICPIPMPAEWLRRGGILAPGRRGIGLNLRWPRQLPGTWLQAAGFLLVGLFAALTLTSPRVTAWVLLGILVMALAAGLIFERRAFCRRLCPIGGFTGLYAQAAPPEIRVKDPALCAAHTPKTCYSACPWGQYPLALRSSADCGLCLECLRVCPSDNIALNLRGWGADLRAEARPRLDQAFLGLVMLASALVDAAVFLGPWGSLKLAAYSIGSRGWWLFAGGFLALALGVVPGLYLLAVWLAGRRADGLRRALARHSPALVPLGLMTWIAFTIAFAFAKAGYVLPVISDPLGWGWHLLGAIPAASPGGTGPLALALQVGLLAVGLAWSCRVAVRLAGSRRAALPLAGFALAFSGAMLWLLVG